MTLLRAARRPFRAIARRYAYPAVAAGWKVAFLGAGLVLRPRLELVQFDAMDRVLAVAPHPDDELLGCGSTLVMHAELGSAVRVIAATDGGRSRAPGLRGTDRISRRAGEFDAAMRALAVPGVWLGLPEGSWSSREMHEALARELEEFRPTIVYAPSPVDYHEEHIAVATVLAGAVAGLDDPPEVRVYQVHVPMTPVLANVGVVPTAAARARAAAAEACYVSQLPNLKRGWRLREQAGALWRTRLPTEVFWRLPANVYARLPDTPIRAFRGIRDRPFTDPLCWMAGLGERRRLARAARRLADAP